MRGLAGGVMRRFQLAFEGVWSEEHQALHLDESVTYEDGRSVDRRWVLTPEAGGALIGYDAVQSARVRARATREGFRVKFDRPAYGRAIGPASVRLDFVEIGPGEVRMSGWASFLGLPLSRTDARLKRLA